MASERAFRMLGDNVRTFHAKRMARSKTNQFKDAAVKGGTDDVDNGPAREDHSFPESR